MGFFHRFGIILSNRPHLPKLEIICDNPSIHLSFKGFIEKLWNPFVVQRFLSGFEGESQGILLEIHMGRSGIRRSSQRKVRGSYRCYQGKVEGSDRGFLGVGREFLSEFQGEGWAVPIGAQQGKLVQDTVLQICHPLCSRSTVL